jgi:putrescine aminotransferase
MIQRERSNPMTYQNHSLSQLQQIDAAHHLHPFTDHKTLRHHGSRIIARADGPFIYDTEGVEILDGMAGLWCVNIGYGRKELAEAAYRQMIELPYYNSFFRCSTPTPVLLSRRLAEIAPKGVERTASSRGTWPITARRSRALRSAEWTPCTASSAAPCRTSCM